MNLEKNSLHSLPHEPLQFDMLVQSNEQLDILLQHVI